MGWVNRPISPYDLWSTNSQRIRGESLQTVTIMAAEVIFPFHISGCNNRLLNRLFLRSLLAKDTSLIEGGVRSFLCIRG